MTDTPERKKARHRSPAYPSIDLRTAIEKLEVIYRAEKRHLAPVAVIAQHCGYDITSSGGARAVAALKQFGLLLEEAGSNDERLLRVSELALDILIAESDESPQRLRAIKTAALSPPLHRKIFEKYGGNLPSKQTLRAFLVRDMDFNDAQVDRFIRQLNQTVSFARLDEPDIIEDSDADDDESSDSSSESDYTPAIGGALFAPASTYIPPQRPSPAPIAYPMQGTQVVVAGTPTEFVRLPLPLPSLKVGWVEVPAKLTETEFVTMINTLTMYKAALVGPPAAPVVPPDAHPTQDRTED